MKAAAIEQPYLSDASPRAGDDPATTVGADGASMSQGAEVLRGAGQGHAEMKQAAARRAVRERRTPTRNRLWA